MRGGFSTPSGRASTGARGRFVFIPFLLSCFQGFAFDGDVDDCDHGDDEDDENDGVRDGVDDDTNDRDHDAVPGTCRFVFLLFNIFVVMII